MKSMTKPLIWSTGIAIFSMFFGSGNVVFPLLLAQIVGHQISWALFGMLITAVGGPLMGLFGSVLFEGDCKAFFKRIGTLPGYIAVLLLLLLLGPLGVMPRCLIVSYGAIKPYFPQLSLFWFSIMGGLTTLFLIWRRDYILPILGWFLSPLLILSLIVIMIVGIVKMHGIPVTNHSPFSAITEGLAAGYDTMDLLASLFFSVGVWTLLKEKLNLTTENEIKTKLIPTYIKASLLGGGLLGLVYLGLSLSAAAHPQSFANAPPEQVLAHLAIYLLGPKLAIVANIAILLACLTTIMSLALAVVEVIHVEMTNTNIAKKIPYNYDAMMVVVIIITVIFSNLGFAGIMKILHPIMAICYPAIIVLTLCNILYKLYGFTYVKIPVYTTLVITLVYQFWPMVV